MALNEGKVDGDKISFFVTSDMNASPTRFAGAGVVQGEEITLTIKAEGGPEFGPTTLKRVQ